MELHFYRVIRLEFGICIEERQTDKLSDSFILVINQLDVQNLFYNKFISCTGMK